MGGGDKNIAYVGDLNVSLSKMNEFAVKHGSSESSGVAEGRKNISYTYFTVSDFSLYPNSL